MTYDEAADFVEKLAFVRDLIQYLEPFSDGIERWRALEIGGGGGVLAGLLAQSFGNVLSTDLVNPQTKHGGAIYSLLRDKFDRNGLALPSDKIEFLAADAQHLPFRGGWFDI